MTRINAGIYVEELPNKLLLTEHREITRIPNAVRYKKVNMKNLPTKFTLGAGHVRFFYNKIGYLYERYQQLYKECKHRNFFIVNKTEAFIGLPYGIEYNPGEYERSIILARFKEKGFTLLTRPT